MGEMRREDSSAQKSIGVDPRQNSSRCDRDYSVGSGKTQINLNGRGGTMSKQVALHASQDAKTQELSVVEQVVMQGDLSKLDPNQRVLYYQKVCESMGLNPFTRPFDYITLNGKLTLYAKKDATEQLRMLKNISLSLESKMVDDLYIVKATARTADGRTDEATGAVTISGLKGDAKANAIMKAETKAKRRVTLSISGMGWTDESEIDSIPGAKKVEIDMSTGEIKNDTAPKAHIAPGPTMGHEQARELEMILGDCDVEYCKSFYNLCQKTYGTICFGKLPADVFPRMKAAALKNMEKHHQQQQETIIEPEILTAEIA